MKVQQANKRQFFWMAAAIVLIVLLDQLSKYFVVKYIPMYGKVPVWNGVLHLTYVRNVGAAFSILSGSGWLFVAVLVVFLAIVGFLVWKKKISSPFELWCLTAVAGGGIANAIDRVAAGSVVDMFEVEFMDFAVFNVADCFITCGAIALAVYNLFFFRESKKAEGSTRETD